MSLEVRAMNKSVTTINTGGVVVGNNVINFGYALDQARVSATELHSMLEIIAHPWRTKPAQPDANRARCGEQRRR